jgi:DNA-binding NtrC family response regulator
MQVKFLRVLQNGTFEPVGSEKTVEVDSRVICATNRDLQSDVATGRFRADLFYRLCVVPISVPPLRSRPGDIPELSRFFLREVSNELDRMHPGITDEALESMSKHRWPGNVRELENTIRYAAIKSLGMPIEPKHLPPHINWEHSPESRPAARSRKLDLEDVKDALEATKGNKSQAARHLGVSRATLYRFLSDNPSPI